MADLPRLQAGIESFDGRDIIGTKPADREGLGTAHAAHFGVNQRARRSA